MSYVVEPVTSAVRLERAIGHLEPRSTILLAEVASFGLDSRHIRCSLVVVDGVDAAAVLHRRVAPLQWQSTVVVVDPAGLTGAGAVLDAGPADVAIGFASHVEPLMGHMERAVGTASVRDVLVADPGSVWGPRDERARPSDIGDLDAMVKLFWESSLHGLKRPSEVRKILTHAHEQGELWVISVDDGSVVAMGHYIDRPRYGYLAQLLTDAAARSSGLGMGVVSAIAHTAMASGNGVVAVFGESNPIPLPKDLYLDDSLWLVDMVPAQRFRGQNRLRSLGRRLLTLGIDRVVEPTFRPGDASTGAAGADALDRWRTPES